MSFKVKYTNNFDRELKRLSKKHRSIKKDFATLLESLENRPNQGIPIGKNCHKIRMAITSKGKGKSGGARVVTHIYVAGETIYLLSIYDKSEQENISEDKIKLLLARIA